jgi:hypothetical protein
MAICPALGRLCCAAILFQNAAALAVVQTQQLNAPRGALRNLDTADAPPDKKKLYFLFLTRDALPNEDIWLRFFESAKSGIDYEAFVHCTNLTGCQRNIRHSNIFKTVPTVPSVWCENLVGAMDQLLSVALSRGAGHEGDKFVFLSDTTVPVKSFCGVKNKLLSDLKSNFCLTSRSAWAWRGGDMVALKHHQWIVLSRDHAQKVVARRHEQRDLLQSLTPLHWLGSTRLSPYVHAATAAMIGWPVPRAWGCLDEYLYVSLIFGFFNRSDMLVGKTIDLEGINGGPIALAGEKAFGLQGHCDTYASFRRDDSGNMTALTHQFDEDPGTDVGAVGRGLFGPLHPVRLNKLSKASLNSLHTSPFLFVRKIDTSTVFEEPLALDVAFERHAFSDCISR